MAPARHGVAARAILRSDDGLVLLLRRAGRSVIDPGCWELPGGKLEHGERLVEALAREVREETGLSAGGTAPFRVTNFPLGPLWVTSVTFICGPTTAGVRLGTEADAYAWLRPAEIGGLRYARGSEEPLRAYAALRDREDQHRCGPWQAPLSRGDIES